MGFAEFILEIAPSRQWEGATAAELHKKESLLKHQIPQDLKSWYRIANGFIGDFNRGMWRLLTVQEINTVACLFPSAKLRMSDDLEDAAFTGDDLLIFCDQHLGIPYYAVNMQDDKFPVLALFPNGRDFDCLLAGASFSTFENLLYATEPEFDLSMNVLGLA